MVTTLRSGSADTSTSGKLGHSGRCSDGSPARTWRKRTVAAMTAALPWTSRHARVRDRALRPICSGGSRPLTTVWPRRPDFAKYEVEGGYLEMTSEEFIASREAGESTTKW